MKYSIYKHYAESEGFKKKLRSIQKKCEKYGNSFYVVVHDNNPYTVNIPCKTAKNGVVPCEMVDIEMVGSPLISGFELIGMLEHHDIPQAQTQEQSTDQCQETSQNIINDLTKGRVHIPARYRTAPAVCEHCKKNIIRTKTYLVRNTGTGEIMQVGSTCMKDFTGQGMSVEDVARFYDIEYDLAHLNDTVDPDSDDYIRAGGSRMMKTQDVIAYALAYIKKDGYIKSGQYDSTKSRLQDCFWGRCEDFSHEDMKPFFEQSAQVQEWARGINHSTCSDYMHNISVAMSTEYSRYNSLGYIGAGVNTWIKEQDKLAQAQLSPSKSQGQVGDKITVQINKVRALYSSTFGVGYGKCVNNTTYRMVDGQGNVFLWKTSTCPFDNLEQGQSFILRGTVKDHSVYKGENQTVLTRCKIVSAA